MGRCSQATLLPLGWATGRELTLKVCGLLNSPAPWNWHRVAVGRSISIYGITTHRLSSALFCYSLNIILPVQDLVSWNVTLRHILRGPRSFPEEPPRVTKQPHTLEERNPRLPRCGKPRTRTHHLLLTLKFSVVTSNRWTRMSSHFSPFQRPHNWFFF